MKNKDQNKSITVRTNLCEKLSKKTKAAIAEALMALFLEVRDGRQ